MGLDGSTQPNGDREIIALLRQERRIRLTEFVFFWLAVLLIFVGPVLAMQWLKGWLGIILSLIALPSGGLAAGLVNIAMRDKRDEARKTRFLRMAATDRRPLILLLRSFTETSTRTPQEWKHSALGAGGWGAAVSRLDYLSDAVEGIGCLLALGPRSSVSEALRYVYLASPALGWEERFQYLANSALLILLLPGVTPGLKTERDVLREARLLEKTIVFMPPTTRIPKKKWYRYPGLFAAMTQWEEARRHWNVSGFALPNYQRGGLVYLPNEDFSVRVGEGLGYEWNQASLRRAVHALLPHVSIGASRSVAEVVAHVTTGGCQAR